MRGAAKALESNMLIRKSPDIPSSEITPKADYLSRRTFMTGIAAAGVTALAAERVTRWGGTVHAAEKLQTVKSPLSLKGETPTSLQDITHYNNFYEFGTDKSDPARNAGALHTRPWTVTVTGLVKKKKTGRHRCASEAAAAGRTRLSLSLRRGWSMVIPWAGYSLSEFIKQCDPLPGAKYVQFLSLADQKQMPRSASRELHFPYSEGLRMDEAMHPLTLLTFGLVW